MSKESDEREFSLSLIDGNVDTMLSKYRLPSLHELTLEACQQKYTTAARDVIEEGLGSGQSSVLMLSGLLHAMARQVQREGESEAPDG